MPECIDRNQLQTALVRKKSGPADKRYTEGWNDCLMRVKSMVSTAPAADVAPVSHSYWEGYSCSQYMGMDEFGEPKWRDGRFYVCHNYRCRRKTVVKSAYCPNCVARMDGDPDGLR